MKSMIVYSSITGNTKKIANAVLKAMPENTEMYKVEEAPLSFEEYDLIAIGYWVDKGTINKEIRDYIKNMENKKIILFGTLGALPNSEYGKKVIVNTKELIHKNQILGSFLCQGKVAYKFIERFKKLPKDNVHYMSKEKIKIFTEGLKHPDETDVKNAESYVKNIVDDL